MYIPTFVFLPAFIGNMWGFMMPKKVNDHITNGLSVMVTIFIIKFEFYFI